MWFVCVYVSESGHAPVLSAVLNFNGGWYSILQRESDGVPLRKTRREPGLDVLSVT